MKTKAKKESHSKTVAELTASIKEAQNEIYELKLQKAQGKLKNLRAGFEKKKNVARMLTILKEKEFKNARSASSGQ